MGEYFDKTVVEDDALVRYGMIKTELGANSAHIISRYFKIKLTLYVWLNIPSPTWNMVLALYCADGLFPPGETRKPMLVEGRWLDFSSGRKRVRGWKGLETGTKAGSNLSYYEICCHQYIHQCWKYCEFAVMSHREIGKWFTKYTVFCLKMLFSDLI